MDKDELKRVEQFIESQHYTAYVDLYDENDTAIAQVIVETTDKRNEDFCYQTSNTCDAGAVSSFLDINSDSGAEYALSSALITAKFSDDFVEDNLQDVANLIAKKLKIQKLFSDYLSEIGGWQCAPNSLDANSEIFVRKGIN